jgi:hypothetical protein
MKAAPWKADVGCIQGYRIALDNIRKARGKYLPGTLEACTTRLSRNHQKYWNNLKMLETEIRHSPRPPGDRLSFRCYFMILFCLHETIGPVPGHAAS